MDYEPTFVIGDMLSDEEDFIRKFTAMADFREYSAGQALARQGEPMPGLFLILGGMVECGFFAENGQKKIIVIHRGRCFFGASSLDGSCDTMNYICMTPVMAAFMPPDRIGRWDGAMLLAFARIQKKKERVLSRQLQMRAFNSADERVLCVLRDMQHAKMTASLTQQTIAEIVGATRVQVSKALKKYSGLSLLPAGVHGDGAAPEWEAGI